MSPSERSNEPPAGDRSSTYVDPVDNVYEDAPVGFVITAVDGTIVEANRAFCELSGHGRDELVDGTRFYDLLPTGAKIYYETHYAPLLEMQGEVREIALEIVRPDTRRVPVLVNAQLIREAGGGAGLVRITVFDATERRKYERELVRARAEAESRAAAARALEHVKEAVVLVDGDGKIVILNTAARRLFQLTKEDEVDGLHLSSVVQGWSAIAGRIPVAGAGEPGSSVVLPLAVTGATRWIAAAGESAENGIVFTLRDVTSERRLEEVRDDIVAVVSHELRTPVAGIYGAAQTLASLGAQLAEPQRELLVQTMVEQSGRLSRIVEEILLTRQIDEGELEVRVTSFEMAALVDRVVQESSEWRNTRPVELPERDSVVARGDPALFEQALVNLLDNAMKYGPAETPIEVRVLRHRSHARVTIADTGPGVRPDDHERIFEKFFRLDPGQLGGISGTGLGLYISRELVRRMQGRVGILPSDVGATFYIDLPVAE